MADWYGKARTNYFRVLDKAKFRKWTESIHGLDIIEDDEGRVGLIFTNEYEGWPRWRFRNDGDSEDEEEEEEIDIVQGVAQHLRQGEVAIFVEIGAEEMRYLTGEAQAVNSRGEVITISLNDIYERAKSLGTNITCAEW